MNESIIDYIIIGGGIAGLYANFLLSKNKNGILLEKNDVFGGRILQKIFHNYNVKLGSGILEDNDLNFIKLIKKLKIKLNSFDGGIIKSFLPEQMDMHKATKRIKKIYKLNKKELNNITTEDFLKKYIDNDFAKQFIKNCLFRDFLKSDIHYFMNYYDFYDVAPYKHKSYYINWDELINKLVKPNCFTNSNVIKIIKNDNIFQIITPTNKYLTNKIILSLTLKPLDNLLKNIIDFRYSDYIGTVPFIRIYTWHSKPYDRSKISNFNIVSNKLSKIIPITDNILMASYSENTDAIKLSKLLNLDKKDQIIKVQELLNELNLGINNIDDILIYFWKEGVHYYKPRETESFSKVFKKISNPIKNIIVLGEIVSKKHGNVEGSIESVNRILKK